MIARLTNGLLDKLGIVSGEWADDLERKIVTRLTARRSTQWLESTTIQEEIAKYCAAHNIHVYRSSPRLVHRMVCIRYSTFLLKKCAKAHGLELVGTRPKHQNRRIVVHEYMASWVLPEEHGHDVPHPGSGASFWHSPQHRDWTYRIVDRDDLVPDMIEQFEGTFSDWLQNGFVVRIGKEVEPVRSVCYEVASAA